MCVCLYRRGVLVCGLLRLIVRRTEELKTLRQRLLGVASLAQLSLLSSWCRCVRETTQSISSLAEGFEEEKQQEEQEEE